jgi:sugar/nucleoside kinase (ribokinase family)
MATWARQGGLGRLGGEHHRGHRGARRAHAYIGKVAKDQLGDVFTHDMRAVGVTYDTTPLTGGLPTRGRSSS